MKFAAANVLLSLGITLLLIATIPAQAEPLGRLFLTPVERAQLDRQRAGMPETSAAGTSPRRAQAARIDGFVKRSDGKTTVWLNGKAEQDPTDGLRISAEAVQTETEVRVTRSGHADGQKKLRDE